MRNAGADVVGWISASILLVTLIRQITLQWRDQRTTGVSAWLFVGQLAASVGFIIYSALVDNLVFVVANSCIATVAIFGQYVYFRNASREASKKAAPKP